MKRSYRRAAIAIETAILLPVFVLFLFGTIVGGIGIFRFEQLAALAREASRYTASHGHKWEKRTGKDSPTQEEIFQDVVAKRAVSMDPTQMSIQIDWINGDTGETIPWDKSSKVPRIGNANNEPVANKIRVTLSYQWLPELIWTGPIQMSTTSELPMSY